MLLLLLLLLRLLYVWLLHALLMLLHLLCRHLMFRVLLVGLSRKFTFELCAEGPAFSTSGSLVRFLTSLAAHGMRWSMCCKQTSWRGSD